MRSTSQRPTIHQYSSLNCRKTVAGEMARSVRTSSPDVSREQARYRRIMELNSAGLETGLYESENFVSHAASASATSYPAHNRYRRLPQTWPRKLEPLPGRVNGFNQLTPPSPPEYTEHDPSFKLPSTPGSNDLSEPSTSTADTASPEDSLSQNLEKEPWGITAAVVAALAPISLPRPNEDPQDADESIVSSVVATATAVMGTPQIDIKQRRLKKLLPISNEESK